LVALRSVLLAEEPHVGKPRPKPLDDRLLRLAVGLGDRGLIRLVRDLEAAAEVPEREGPRRAGGGERRVEETAGAGRASSRRPTRLTGGHGSDVRDTGRRGAPVATWVATWVGGSTRSSEGQERGPACHSGRHRRESAR